MIPDNVEKVIITKEDYDRNVEQLLLDKCNAELEVEKLNDLLHKTNDELVSYVDECIRLNNIIDALEKYMRYERINNGQIDEWTIMEIQMKLKELKESE